MRSAWLLILCVFGLTFGCAHSHDRFYYSDGVLCAEMKSTVIGTGEAKKTVASSCAVLKYDTEGTGFSENATKLGGKIAEGLTKGAAKGLVPIP